MQPFKPYFLGRETPPAPRLTDVQKCFRTTDIEEVGNTARHMTFFEMLGNWSFGDYFKAESIPWGWQLADRGLRHGPGEDLGDRLRRRRGARARARHRGDRDLGSESASPPSGSSRSAARTTSGRAGRPGPAARARSSTSTAGPTSATADERPGDEGERFLEFWNHVFISYDLAEDGTLTELPMRNIDTGMGLDRMAAILQDVPSVFDVDHVRPLIDLAEELSGHRYDESAGGDAGDADRRRPLARRRLPDRRRRRPLQRGPRLHPAADHAAGDPAGQHARPRGALARPLRRARDRADGRGLPGAGRRAGDDRPLGRRRGGELRPHAGARGASCWSG